MINIKKKRLVGWLVCLFLFLFLKTKQASKVEPSKVEVIELSRWSKHLNNKYKIKKKKKTLNII